MWKLKRNAILVIAIIMLNFLFISINTNYKTIAQENWPVLEGDISSSIIISPSAISPTITPEALLPTETPGTPIAPTATPEVLLPTNTPVAPVSPTATPEVFLPTEAPESPEIVPIPEPVASPDSKPTQTVLPIIWPEVTPTPEWDEEATPDPEKNTGIGDRLIDYPHKESLISPASIIPNEAAIISAASINVMLPEEVPFTINPCELNGKEQIYSDDFFIYNYSNVDITVNLTALQYMFADEENFLSLEDPDGIDEIREAKAIYMTMQSSDMDIENGELIVITETEQTDVRSFSLKASNFNEEGEWESFNDDSFVFFNFSGNVNLNPPKLWFSDDVTVRLVFSYHMSETEPFIDPFE